MRVFHRGSRHDSRIDWPCAGRAPGHSRVARQRRAESPCLGEKEKGEKKGEEEEEEGREKEGEKEAEEETEEEEEEELEEGEEVVVVLEAAAFRGPSFANLRHHRCVGPQLAEAPPWSRAGRGFRRSASSPTL